MLNTPSLIELLAVLFAALVLLLPIALAIRIAFEHARIKGAQSVLINQPILTPTPTHVRIIVILSCLTILAMEMGLVTRTFFPLDNPMNSEAALISYRGLNANELAHCLEVYAISLIISWIMPGLFFPYLHRVLSFWWSWSISFTAMILLLTGYMYKNWGFFPLIIGKIELS